MGELGESPQDRLLNEVNQTEDGEAFHFSSRNQRLSETVIHAVAWVKGVDPVDLEPLAEFIDPAALDVIFANTMEGTLGFEMEGLDIRAHGSGEVVVMRPERVEARHHPVHDELEDASNVLLLGDSNVDELCSELLFSTPSRDLILLGISLGPSVDERLRVWEAHAGEPPPDLHLISAGEPSRGRGDSSESHSDPENAWTTEFVSGPDDLTELGVTINDRMNTLEKRGSPITLCFHSISRLLQQIDEERSFRFIHLVQGRMNLDFVLAHYHLDPNLHDQVTVSKFASLFDATVSVDEDGTWRVN